MLSKLIFEDARYLHNSKDVPMGMDYLGILRRARLHAIGVETLVGVRIESFDCRVLTG